MIPSADLERVKGLSLAQEWIYDCFWQGAPGVIP